jgi:hypothetical protein
VIFAGFDMSTFSPCPPCLINLALPFNTSKSRLPGVMVILASGLISLKISAAPVLS